MRTRVSPFVAATFIALLALLSLAALPLSAAAAETPRALFHLLGPDDVRAEAAAASPEVTATERVSVDLDALGTEIRVPLLDGVVYDAVRTDLERRGPRDFAWRGNVFAPGDRTKVVGTMVLTVSGDRMAGALWMPTSLYKIEPVPGGGGHRLIAVDGSRLPGCAGELSPHLEGCRSEGRLLPEAATVAKPPLRAATASPKATTRLDILVVYTPFSRDQAGGDAAIRLAIQNAVDSANSAYLNSQIDLHMNLVGASVVNYVETGDPEADLGWLQQDRTVANLRRSVGADVVSMFVNLMKGACGIGYVMDRDGLSKEFSPFAYSDVLRTCAPFFVLAHEVGHNLGCQHDPANGEPPDVASFPYAYGHFVDGMFHTVMSYDNQCGTVCQGINYFSNPAIAWNGLPTGIAEQRDNHRAINNTKDLVASFNSPQPCKPGPNTLCLLGKRFRAEVVWENQFNATSGVGSAVPRTDQAGFFTFGDPTNIEIMVKILDFGTAIKVFYGELTNLHFSLIVSDTKNGTVKTYTNSPGDCGAIDQDFAGAASAAGASGALTPKAASGSCRPGRNTLCLANGRFQVAVDWSNPGNGTSGLGGAVPLSKVTGAFFFTDPSNLELMTKMIDFGDRIAFFYGTLTDLDYTLTVTDTLTAAVKTYHNPAGNYCGGLDNNAF